MARKSAAPAGAAFLVVLAFFSLHGTKASPCGYSTIFSFGDSLADTGNRAFAPDHAPSFCINPPYGMTYFEKPTGRCSDGRLVLDFVAEAMGVPLLPPYLKELTKGTDMERGVNFAVAGATALSNGFFTDQGINTWTNNSLGVQVEWFRSLLPSLCPKGTSSCDLVHRSLFMMGEIGGNDFNYPFLQKWELDRVRAMVPEVIGTISKAIRDLVGMGARVFLVPGNFPIGCSASYLTYFSPAAKPEDFDPATGCINWLNQFVVEYNRQLQDELDRLRALYPEATIIYADYYRAAMRVYRDPARFGFTNALQACCGGYNTASEDGKTTPLTCGHPGSAVCADPSKYVSWDGTHLTEAAYRAISAGLLEGTFAYPSAAGLCPADASGGDHVMTQ